MCQIDVETIYNKKAAHSLCYSNFPIEAFCFDDDPTIDHPAPWN